MITLKKISSVGHVAHKYINCLECIIPGIDPATGKKF
jgi:hypothetical protein